MDLEQFYDDTVASAVQKAELEIAIGGIDLADRDRELIKAAVGIGASEVLIKVRRLLNGEEQ